MKNNNCYSLLSCIIISIVLITTRFIYSPIGNSSEIKVTTWDAFGYYMYLPAKYIYHDETKLLWVDSIEKKYSLTGGNLYQSNKQENGNYVNKYLMGVSQLQLPFFFLAHQYAKFSSNYEADGFSKPYQYAIAFGCIFYCLLAIFLLRKILLKYYEDKIVAITLFLILIASNFIQYVSIDSAQSHGYIFPLYVLILWATIKWHVNKSLVWMFLIGYIIGTATISRPTEAVILFIPLLWNIFNWKDFKEKINYFLSNYSQLIIGFVGIFLAILPQLLYWKRVTNSWVYDVGSKWDFLNPHFRVLFGFEKGWFIYTPITIFFIIGFFFIKQKVFTKSVIIFCLLNIYIIIAWHIWRYGGSYSTRALVQSYPLFAFPLAGFIKYTFSNKWKYVILPIFAFLIFVNLFQIKQYNKNILHFDEMNFKYYKAIFLNNHPTALDMSLLDTDEKINNENGYYKNIIFENTYLSTKNNDTLWISPSKINKNTWLKFNITIEKSKNVNNVNFCFSKNEKNKIRLGNPIYKENENNDYEFFMFTDNTQKQYLIIEGNENFEAENCKIKITQLNKK